MTGGSVVSKAALAVLEAPFAQIESDPLLHLICTISSPHQLSVLKAGKGVTLSLKINDGATSLTQRNAIVRALCGITLHNALDGSPYYLLGGHATMNNTESPIVIAAISSWMSVADAIRTPGCNVEEISKHLNDEVLSTNSFLIGNVPSPTVADLDVFFALMDIIKSSNTCDFITSSANLKRWFLQCHATALDMLSKSPKRNAKLFPEMTVPGIDDIGIDLLMPHFFFECSDDDITNAKVEKILPESSSNAVVKDKIAKASVAGSEAKGKAAKKADKKKEKAAGKKEKSKATPPLVDSLDISALDIRVGKIVEVWEHESSEKLWCEKIDIGENEPRQILSGLREFYSRDQMESQGLVLVLCNLKKRNLGGIPSHGMVLCASNADHTEVEFVIPPPNAKIGERVLFDGVEDKAPEPENKVAKKKLHEKLLPDLKTDSNGVVVWKGSKSRTSGGECVACKGAKDRQVG